ncbi:MAG: aminoacyl-tRNA hydrolase [Gammaproteobacteria bacterium]
MPAAIKLIAGLGNPGTDHADTRHNAGFWFADQLVDRIHAGFSNEKKLFCELARIREDGHDLRVIKPQTWMNESGRAVQAVADYYDIDCKQILVVHDEIDLPTGTIRLKQGGGHGGNNGLRSISQCLTDNGYYRLRIGIDHPGSKEQVTPYVLSRPGKQDKALIEAAIQRGLDVLPLILNGELEKAMQTLHTPTEQVGM